MSFMLRNIEDCFRIKFSGVVAINQEEITISCLALAKGRRQGEEYVVNGKRKK